MTNHTIIVLSILVQDVPVGTNLGLLQFLWMMVSGALLPNRGAIHPALQSIGLEDDAIRRAWAAFRKGAWQTSSILVLWSQYVKSLPGWQEHCYEDYRPVAADVTAFWRPALKNCPSKHYHPAAGRALPAVIFGITGEIGEINGQRLALPRAFERAHPKDSSEGRLWYEILRSAKKRLEDFDILVLDAGVKIRQVLAAGIEIFELRLAVNFTARRNYLPKYEKGRPHEYGELVRPLPRKGKNGIIEATPPDEIYEWVEDGRTIRAEIWRELVFNEQKVSEENKTFDVYAIYDPEFDKPWLLAVSVPLKPESVRAIYKDRWPIEQIPLSAKHMVGAHRQFVHNEESIQRLPELALLTGSILSFLAATMPAIPTGFWDRKPKRTPGRFRRALIGKPFPKDAPISSQVRKKNSVTDHLPKGILGHRRKKSPLPA
ncbi:MAG: hypothetical protein U9O54_03610 [Chloroflexota bacterium]|nr:hypothetical protein [Chloroflexota bacterium]